MTSSPRVTVLFLLLAASASPLAAETAPRKPVAPRAPAADELRAAPRTGRLLLLRTVAFDPTAEAPDFTAVDLPSQPDSPDYGVVQFLPGRTAEKERLAKLGVRFFGYLPENAWQVRLTPRTQALLDASDAVRWQGLWEPGFKVSPRLLSGSGEFTAEITVVLFPDASTEEVTATLLARVPDAFRTFVHDDPASPRLRFAVPLSVRRDFLREAASIPGTAWLEPYVPRELLNNASLGPIQSNQDSNVANGGCTNCTLFAHGLTGTGQIVAVLDSGCDTDICFFRKSGAAGDVTDAEDTEPPAVGNLWPAKKVIAYWVQPGATAYDNDNTCRSSSTSYHGTHTSGTAVGDDYHTPSTSSFPGIDVGDGMAPNAQLLFQDFGNDSSGCLVGIDSYPVYLQALTGGARIHSNSTGSSTNGAYTAEDQDVDRFLFDHDEMTIFAAAGNEGPGSTSGSSPGNAKNVVSVGAVGHGSSTQVISFSSRGPAADGRIKPEVMAPGSGISSARGDDSHTSNNCGVQNLSGTSMATPTAAGATALLRQYFTDGFYPTGAAQAGDRLNPPAPLVKAALLNGTLPLGVDPGFGNNSYGWGRVFLDNNLHFAGDARKLRVWNLANAQGVKTGDVHRYTVTVGAGQEFRVTLVWSDAEGTLGAAAALVNDLDLTVTDGTSTWRGNSFATGGDSRLGGEVDNLNNVEQVKLSAPEAGTYTVTVTASHVPGNGRELTDRQGYALAVSMASCATKVTAAPAGLSAASNAVMGVDLSFTPAPNVDRHAGLPGDRRVRRGSRHVSVRRAGGWLDASPTRGRKVAPRTRTFSAARTAAAKARRGAASRSPRPAAATSPRSSPASPRLPASERSAGSGSRGRPRPAAARTRRRSTTTSTARRPRARHPPARSSGRRPASPSTTCRPPRGRRTRTSFAPRKGMRAARGRTAEPRRKPLTPPSSRQRPASPELSAPGPTMAATARSRCRASPPGRSRRRRPPPERTRTTRAPTAATYPNLTCAVAHVAASDARKRLGAVVQRALQPRIRVGRRRRRDLDRRRQHVDRPAADDPRRIPQLLRPDDRQSRQRLRLSEDARRLQRSIETTRR